MIACINNRPEISSFVRHHRCEKTDKRLQEMAPSAQCDAEEFISLSLDFSKFSVQVGPSIFPAVGRHKFMEII